MLKDSNSKVRSSAASALNKICAEAKTVLPQLIVLLKDSNSNVRSSAASALNKICAEAKTVVPQLVAVDKVEF
ncbi:HEAT repeat domain-containing protein [Microcoleus sp. K5-D4]|uniref:HEAT repeat domain-containing protein n=1 Tax=Microcoleus sp. K5-D4 TaxID=2818801 RepID=UPI002FD52955